MTSAFRPSGFFCGFLDATTLLSTGSFCFLSGVAWDKELSSANLSLFSRPALISIASGHRFCSAVCLLVFKLSDFCCETYWLVGLKQYKGCLAREGAGEACCVLRSGRGAEVCSNQLPARHFSEKSLLWIWGWVSLALAAEVHSK